MEIKLGLTGNERKALVKAIGDILEITPKYQGAPTFAYEIGEFEVDKNGTLCFDDNIDGEVAENLIMGLEHQGYSFKEVEDALAIEVPKSDFTERTLANLEKLIESKADLIKKAIGTENLNIEQTDSTLRFAWFSLTTDPNVVKAYTQFVTALCELARTQLRVTAKEKSIDNEKYAFRCFLLRLGFIGDEYKTERKILLSKLTGSSAFKSGKPQEAEE